MAARCTFCNNSIILGEEEVNGVDPETLKIVKKDENAERLYAEAKEKLPETLGSIEVGTRKGFVVNHQTGEKRWVEKS